MVNCKMFSRICAKSIDQAITVLKNTTLCLFVIQMVLFLDKILHVLVLWCQVSILFSFYCLISSDQYLWGQNIFYYLGLFTLSCGLLKIKRSQLKATKPFKKDCRNILSWIFYYIFYYNDKFIIVENKYNCPYSRIKAEDT